MNIETIVNKSGYLTGIYLIGGYAFLIAQSIFLVNFFLLFNEYLVHLQITDFLTYLFLFATVVIAFLVGFAFELLYDFIDGLLVKFSSQIVKHLEPNKEKKEYHFLKRYLRESLVFFDKRRHLNSLQVKLFVDRFLKSKIGKDCHTLFKDNDPKHSIDRFDIIRYIRIQALASNHISNEDVKEVQQKITLLKNLTIGLIFLYIEWVVITKTFPELFISLLFLTAILILIKEKNKIESTVDSDLILSSLEHLYSSKS